MSFVRKWQCDGCGNEIESSESGEIVLYEVSVEQHDKPGFITKAYKRSSWDLCPDCAEDIVAAIKIKKAGTNE